MRLLVTPLVKIRGLWVVTWIWMHIQTAVTYCVNYLIDLSLFIEFDTLYSWLILNSFRHRVCAIHSQYHSQYQLMMVGNKYTSTWANIGGVWTCASTCWLLHSTKIVPVVRGIQPSITLAAMRLRSSFRRSENYARLFWTEFAHAGSESN